MPTRAELSNLAERSLWTFLQYCVASLLVADGLDISLDAAAMAALAGLAAVLSLVKTFALDRLNKGPAPRTYTDAAWRGLWTFLWAALSTGILAVPGAVDFDVNALEASLVAGVTAVLALAKSFASLALVRMDRDGRHEVEVDPAVAQDPTGVTPEYGEEDLPPADVDPQHRPIGGGA